MARNLESGHTYEFVVAAANMAGVGPTSVPAQATVRTPTPRRTSGTGCTSATAAPASWPGVLTTRYYFGPTWGIWDIFEDVRRLGDLDVGDVRTGTVDIAPTIYTHRCLKRYTWAQLTWIDINGKTQRLADTSKTVMYTGRGVSCKVIEY